MNELERQARELLKKNNFINHNFIELEHVERDYAAFRLRIRPESINSYGVVQGGVMYTMADIATAAAAFTDERVYVTQTGTLHYLRNLSEGTIRAVARVRHRGRSTALMDVEVTDETGALLAAGDFTFFCTGQQQENG